MASESERKTFSLDLRDFYLIAAFFLLFTLLTPLGLYKPSLPKEIHTGYYSVISPDWGDDAGYYSYLRSFFFDGDIDFLNEKKYAHFDKILPTGYIFNHWSIGPSVFWTPFFLFGHLLAWCLSATGLNISMDGYSFPYYISTAIGSTLFSFCGIFLLSKVLSRFFEKKIAYLSSFIVFASTGLTYFTFIRQRMAHSLEFLLVVIFLFLWIKVRENEYKFQWVVLWGVFAGVLAFTRYNDVTFLIIPGIDFSYRLFACLRQKGNKYMVLRDFGYFLGSFIVTIIPLFIVWQILNGVPYPVSWSQYPSFILSFNLINVFKRIAHFFAGEDWGVFISEPVWLIALPGVYFFLKKEPFYGILLCMSAIFPIYISANIGGGASEASFGHRFALAVNPVLSFGVAALLSKTVRNKTAFNALLTMCGLFILYKYVQLIQYKIVLPYDDPKFAIRSIMNIPLLLENYNLWIRSTSIWKVLFYLKEFKLIDFIFIILLPLSIFLGSYFIVVLFCFFVKSKWSVNYGLSGALFALLLLYLAVFSVYDVKSSEEIVDRYFVGAKIQLLKKNPQEALSNLKKALRIDNKNIMALNASGEILADILGNKKGGAFYFQKSLSISPNQEKAELLKQKLQSIKTFMEAEGKQVD